MAPCSLLPCKVLAASPPPCVCRVCLVRVLCGPAWRGRLFQERAGAHAAMAEVAQRPTDQGQGGGRPGGHLRHPGCARGKSAAPRSCAGWWGRLRTWRGAAARPGTGQGGLIWAGGQAQQSQGTSAGWATSARTGTRGTRTCMLGCGAGGSAAVRGGAGATEPVLARAEAWSTCGWLGVPWMCSGYGGRPSCGSAALGAARCPGAAGSPSTGPDAGLVRTLGFILTRRCGQSL